MLWSNDQAEAGAKNQQMTWQSPLDKLLVPVRHGTCVAVQTKRLETDMLCGSNYQAEAGAKISK